MGEPRGVCMCVSLCVGRGGPLPPAWGRGLQGDVDVGGARARALPPVRKMARRGQARAAVQDVSSPSAQSALGFGTRLSVNFRLHLPPPPQSLKSRQKYSQPPGPSPIPAPQTLKEIDDVYEKYKKEDDSNQKKRLQQHLQRALINSQELGDEKIQIVTQMLELVENRARQMELHSQCFQDPAESERAADKAKMDSSQPERSSRRPRRQRTSESRDLCHMTNGIEDCDDQPPKEKKSKSAKKKKRSKAKQEREASPVEFAIDPNEPTYCLCNQVSYGEMIGCDNEQCPIEWFHFSCVSLTYKPKGKWYCPKCRGDNEKTMDKSTEKTKKERRSR
ncbi:inhibitor of growth protein 2 isoform X1 [Bos taurus]|uniref:Inhibitor of growth protein n=1 Tax=Bos taurus TaxID=9913 RepID=A0AAA9TEI5_BOVIN|nr:inhibitor of growth protein 2 isoform X1 [Bos taurus]